jgi:3-methyladenine DNA glycosylase AlkD
MINYDAALAEIQVILGKLSLNEKPSGIKNLQQYVGTNYHFYSLKNPTVQAVFKQGFSFSHEPMQVQMEFYIKLWNESNCYEIMNLSLMYLSIYCKKHKDIDAFLLAKRFLPKIDNWAHSDFLSSIIGRHMIYAESSIFDELHALNNTENLWERRASLVPLLYHLKSKKSTLTETHFFDSINPRISDEAYFVQKAVGWLLREFGEKFPKKLLSFLYNNAFQMSSTAFATATEKISSIEKEQLKLIRKEFKRLKK